MPDRDEAGDDGRGVSEIEEGDEAAGEDQMDEDEVAEQILDVEGVPTTPSRQINKAKSAKASATKTPKAKGTAKASKTPGMVKKKKQKPRKSEQLNLNALSQEQLVVTEMKGSKIQQLKLQRKWLDGTAMPLCNFLAPTRKAEVSEAMEYFRVAWEYCLDTAPVCYSRFPFFHYPTTLVFPSRDQGDGPSRLDRGQHICWRGRKGAQGHPSQAPRVLSES